jgi:hypothetical protein
VILRREEPLTRPGREEHPADEEGDDDRSIPSHPGDEALDGHHRQKRQRYQRIGQIVLIAMIWHDEHRNQPQAGPCDRREREPARRCAPESVRAYEIQSSSHTGDRDSYQCPLASRQSHPLAELGEAGILDRSQRFETPSAVDHCIVEKNTRATGDVVRMPRLQCQRRNASEPDDAVNPDHQQMAPQTDDGSAGQCGETPILDLQDGQEQDQEDRRLFGEEGKEECQGGYGEPVTKEEVQRQENEERRRELVHTHRPQKRLQMNIHRHAIEHCRGPRGHRPSRQQAAHPSDERRIDDVEAQGRHVITSRIQSKHLVESRQIQSAHRPEKELAGRGQRRFHELPGPVVL